MKQLKRISLSLSLAGAMLLSSVPASALSIAAHSYQLKKETVAYLRMLDPMMANFGTKPEKGEKAEDEYFVDLAKQYEEAKNMYTIGMAYLYENNYQEAYTEFKRCQVTIEKLLELLSQHYVTRAREIARASISDMHPNPEGNKGVSLLKVTIEYGPNSKVRRYLRVSRRAPMESRYYDPKRSHLAFKMQDIENNVNMAFDNIGKAVEYRNKAVQIEHSMETHKKLRPLHRRKRIDWYFRSIKHSRQSKKNSLNVFIMKYPYENIQHQSNKMANGKEWDYDGNPHYLPKSLNPVFDERIPRQYRRDASDVLGYTFNDEYQHKIRLASWRNGEWMKCDNKGENCKPIN